MHRTLVLITGPRWWFGSSLWTRGRIPGTAHGAWGLLLHMAHMENWPAPSYARNVETSTRCHLLIPPSSSTPGANTRRGGCLRALFAATAAARATQPKTPAFRLSKESLQGCAPSRGASSRQPELILAELAWCCHTGSGEEEKGDVWLCGEPPARARDCCEGKRGTSQLRALVTINKPGGSETCLPALEQLVCCHSLGKLFQIC